MAKKRPNRTNRTPKKRTATDWSRACLVSLAECGNISEACKVAGVGRQTFYDRRDADDTFAAAATEALEVATEALELEARRRAKDGCDRPVFHQGAQCGVIREYSDTLMIFLLKAHKPEKYRENIRHEHTGEGGGPIRFIEVRRADPSPDRGSDQL